MAAGLGGGFLGTDVLDLARQRMDWAGRRLDVLAQNVANADTPGYRPKDIAPFAAFLSGAGVALAQTEPGHMAATVAASAPAVTGQGAIAPDGNGVAIDRELTRVADTESAHALASQLFQAYSGMFRTALGR
jgi:flagellar basal-body rod protein FlgB